MMPPPLAPIGTVAVVCWRLYDPVTLKLLNAEQHAVAHLRQWRCDNPGEPWPSVRVLCRWIGDVYGMEISANTAAKALRAARKMAMSHR